MWIIVGQGTSSIAYSYDGTTWYYVTNSKNIFSIGGYGLGSNSKIGYPIVPSQLVLDKNGPNLTNQLDLVSDTYCNSGYTNFTTTIQSNDL
jgi:hypothetical protein